MQEFAAAIFPSLAQRTGEVAVTGKCLPIRVIRAICGSDVPEGQQTNVRAIGTTFNHTPSFSWTPHSRFQV
jgi:hypothetical protein